MTVTVTSQFEQALQAQDKQWKPTVKQGKFAEIPFEVDEAGYGGALGAGKSDILMLLPLIWGLYEHEKYKGLFLRRTFPELEGEIIPRSKEFFPSTGAVYNESKRRWQFPNGGLDIFGHCEAEKDVKKYDTLQATLIRWDEATSFTGFQYEYLTLRRGRVPPGYPWPAMSRWGSNPGNVGHVYFRKRFLDPYKKLKIPFGSKILRDERTGALRTFVPATATDNPHLLEANPKYYQKLEGISSEAERRAMILGDWYVFEGQVFEEFRLEPLPDEPLNARHVIDPFNIPFWWPKVMAIDWGFSAFTFVLWFAISPSGRAYVYRAYAVKKAKIKVWARELILLTGEEKDNVRDIGICFSAGQDQGHEQTIFEQVAEALSDAGFKCGLVKSERNRVGGKQLIHEYLRWKPVPLIKDVIGEYDQELARKIERIHGPDALKKYIGYFEPEEPELNLPKLQIFRKTNENIIECDKALELLYDTIPSCVYDDVRKEDVKEFDGDDSYDCLRIGLYRVADHISSAQSEFDRFQKIDLASKRLADAGDQTSFYRICEAAEQEQRNNFSVRKSGGRRIGMSRMSNATSRARYR